MNVIKKFGRSGSKLVFFAVSAILCVICAIFMFSLFAHTHEVWGYYYIEDIGEISGETYILLQVFTGLCCVGSLASIVSCYTICKNCLSICDDKIIGTGFKFGDGKNIVIFSEEFDVRYSEVLSVNMNRKIIKIETAMKTYKVLVENSKEAYQMLFERVKH